VGKTRLLVEWCTRHGGAYFVADQSTHALQRRYLAEAMEQRLPGFAQVTYPDWSALFTRLAKEAATAGWRGPLVLDELPYLVQASPELPSVLQRWVDHEARNAGLTIAVAGSAQRMMQGLVLDRSAPLYGRATEALQLRPLTAGHLAQVFSSLDPCRVVEWYSAWGGIPYYWELAHDVGGTDLDQLVDTLVLDPRGVLHAEPERLLLEEVPPATALRPLLDAVGQGAHRVSEMASRIEQPASSLARPISRLVEMELIERQTPFGELERNTKRSLYRIADPFMRLWFRVVAPHRASLEQVPRATRLALWRPHAPHLAAQTWEELCRAAVPRLSGSGTPAGESGPWGAAKRYWKGSEPEWDVVAGSIDGGRLLLGECKWSSQPMSATEVARQCAELAARPIPEAWSAARVNRVLFVPRASGQARTHQAGVALVDAGEVLEALLRE